MVNKSLVSAAHGYAAKPVVTRTVKDFMAVAAVPVMTPDQFIIRVS
jgi:hypothetical protein